MIPPKSPPPTQAALLMQQAANFYRQNQHTKALVAVQSVLQKTPRDVVALNLAGACCMALQRRDEAETYFRQAVDIQPDFAEGHFGLACLYQELRRYAESETHYQRVIALRPGFAFAHYNLGCIYQMQGRSAEALAAFTQAITHQPDYAEAHNNLGNLYQLMGRHGEAIQAYLRCVELRPNNPEIFSNLGKLLDTMHKPAEAEAAYRHALALKPDYPDALNHLGGLLANTGRPAEAEAAYRQAIAISPNFAAAWSNLGCLLHDVKRLPEAEAASRHAFALAPDMQEVRWNLSLRLLYSGQWQEGWPLFEARYHAAKSDRNVIPPSLPYPQWQGEALAGKSLLVWLEQGLGDEIQFARYLPLLKAQGAAHITLVCQPALLPLFRSLAGVDTLLAHHPDLAVPPHDYWVLLCSLPLHFNTTPDTVPASMPYLQADAEHLADWQTGLAGAGHKVGLVWQGNPAHRNDANRSLPGLTTLAPLWQVPDVQFYSLQKGRGEVEAATPPADQTLANLGPTIRHFADTAAIVSQLDLVICVDTAIAHLAGALGKPCWVLLPYTGTDWRWLDSRDDSPWYPGVMRLFRQPAAGDWATPVAQMTAALAAWGSGA